MNRSALHVVLWVIIVGCSGSSGGDGGGGSGGSPDGGSSSGGSAQGGSTSGGTSYGGTISGGGTSATGGVCPCGGCGGPPLCCGPDGSVGVASACDHSCPSGMTPGYGLCPGQCYKSSDCAADEFCHSPSPCWGLGTCLARPPNCSPSDGGAPVCGCDGAQYASECEANAAGQDVNQAGTCQ